MIVLGAKSSKFLNGVCRHELMQFKSTMVVLFLNGVCRHERHMTEAHSQNGFLNGVCRHEQLTMY